ncbi:MAG: SDR family NAD(P)-dependent oxidoreductase [Spirochaetota bacterium]
MGMLDGKTALVTGGGTGVGRAAVLRFAEAGANVAVNYSRSQGDAEATAEEARAFGVKAIAVKADVANEDEVLAMFDQVERELGPVVILVNNAGRTQFVPFTELDRITDELWQEILNTNVMGTFYCSRAAARGMKREGDGTIINVSSVSGLTGFGSSIPYATSKAAILSLTRSLAQALAPTIRVNALAPGLIETRWVADQPEFVEGQRANTPLKRNASPDDVAQVIFAFATSADFVTGQTLVVDGGRRM